MNSGKLWQTVVNSVGIWQTLRDSSGLWWTVVGSVVCRCENALSKCQLKRSSGLWERQVWSLGRLTSVCGRHPLVRTDMHL